MALWFFPIGSPLKPINTYEEATAKSLPTTKANQYRHSRGYARHALSQILKLPPLDIPLVANPGEPPKLPAKLGHISFSHCCDALLIGWSGNKIGVDIERTDRSFSPKRIANRYFDDHETAQIRKLNNDELRLYVLQHWLCKEAAIKWQKGNIANDLASWKVINNFQSAIHSDLKYQVSLHLEVFEEWSFAIACEKGKLSTLPIICWGK